MRTKAVGNFGKPRTNHLPQSGIETMIKWKWAWKQAELTPKNTQNIDLAVTWAFSLWFFETVASSAFGWKFYCLFGSHLTNSHTKLEAMA